MPLHCPECFKEMSEGPQDMFACVCGYSALQLNLFDGGLSMEKNLIEKRTVGVFFNLTPNERKNLRHICLDRGQSMNSFCAEAVIKRLAEIDERPKK